MHLINGINKRNIAASAEENDPLFTKYFNVLSETYSGKLYMRGIEKGTDRNFDLAIEKSEFERYWRGYNHNKNDYDTPELCSMNISKQEISCPHGFFVCKDHTCVVETSRCDGQEDCVSGDDEIGCSEICSNPDPTEKCTRCTMAEGCNTLYFQCSSGGCVSATPVCDGVESCVDGSDEALCNSRRQPVSCEVNLNQACPMSNQIKVFLAKMHLFQKGYTYKWW